MNRFRNVVIAVALLALAGGSVGCGVSPEDGARASNVLELLPNVSLPALPVDIDDQGRITRIAGLDVETIEGLTRPVAGDISYFRIPIMSESQVAWLKESNVQHITLATRENGLFLLVNGDPLPAIAWDDTSLANLVSVLDMFQRDGQGAYLISAEGFRMMRDVIPMLPKLGLRIDLRLPRAEDNVQIPLPTEDELTAALTDRDEVMGEPMQTVALQVEYKELPDNNGWVPSVFGLTTVDMNDILSSLSAQPINRFRLRSDIRDRMEVEGISSLGLQARHDGVFMSVDGLLMPHLAWSDGSLANLAGLLDQLYEGRTISAANAWVPVVKATAPIFNDFDLSVTVTFPVAEAE